MEIDWEAPLVELLGDVAGHQIAEGLADSSAGAKAPAPVSSGRSRVPAEEGRLTPPKAELEHFYDAVQSLQCASSAPKQVEKLLAKAAAARHHNESRRCPLSRRRALSTRSVAPRASASPTVFLLCACSRALSPRHDAAGERLRPALEDLGPVFVKFGQLLSTRRDLLPTTSPMNWPASGSGAPFPAKEAIQRIEGPWASR